MQTGNGSRSDRLLRRSARSALIAAALGVLALLCICSPAAAEQAVSQGTILVSIANGQGDDTLCVLKPDAGTVELFSFHGHPKQRTGRILDLRIAPDGRSICCVSDNAYAWTPASRNIFRIAASGASWRQLTPGPCSGIWNAVPPFGAVAGTVKHRDGRPMGSAPVFLEGMDMIYAAPDGAFHFPLVPEGRRWLVAYRPGSTVFDSQEIVVARGTTARADLVPVSDFRLTFANPVAWRDRVYFILSGSTIGWTDENSRALVKVYAATQGGTGVADIDGFDVAPSTGRLAILDWQTGCPTNRGLYLAGGDGQSPALLVDMKNDSGWCGAGDAFWSPDERRIAVKCSYNWQTGLAVFDASTGAMTGSVSFNDRKYTLFNVRLHGWSADGNWLLYSHFANDASKTTLSIVRVLPDGSVDHSQASHVLVEKPLSGATWGVLNP